MILYLTWYICCELLKCTLRRVQSNGISSKFSPAYKNRRMLISDDSLIWFDAFNFKCVTLNKSAISDSADKN